MTEPEINVLTAGPTEIDAAMKEFIAEQEKEFSAVPPEPTPAPEVKPEVPAELQIAAQPDPAERGLERLVAREVELRERENKIATYEDEVKALRARLQELEPRAINDDLLNRIRLSPSDGLRAMGLDPDEVVRLALVEKLGDKANSPETKEMLEKAQMRKEMQALKGYIQQIERERAAKEYFNKIAEGANSFTRNLDGLSKHAPTVAAVAKTSPDRVFQEIMEEITRDAAVRAAREPNGDVISYEEAAKRVESRWGAMKALLGGAAPGNPANASTPVNPGSPETKQNVAKETPKAPPSTVKPPEKPLAPWLQKRVDEEEAIQLALQEYRRVESLK